MDLSVIITRTELSLADLELNAAPYTVVGDGIEPGQTELERHQATSPFVDGTYTISSKRNQPSMVITLDVRGDTTAEINTNVDTLVNAFDQDVFEVAVTIDGQSFRWRGERADRGVGWRKERWHAYVVRAAFQFPRHPIPLTGAV